MANKFSRGKIVDGRADPRSARAIERRREMRAEDSAEIARISGHLLMTLGRPATIADELRAELIGRTATRIRRLAEKRRESIAERQLLEQLLAKPFNAPASTLGPKVEGSGQTYFVATKGGDTVPDGPISPNWPAPPMTERSTD